MKGYIAQVKVAGRVRDLDVIVYIDAEEEIEEAAEALAERLDKDVEVISYKRVI